MLSPHDFREIASGQRKGPFATLMRLGLSLAELPYTLAVRVRNHRYDVGTATTHRIGVPVVCVGNLTLGGTGKTPMVHYLANMLVQRGLRVVIVSRGYRKTSGGQNDEAKELAERLPSVPHIQNPDRVAAARQAIGQFNAQVIVLDDGFQHRRLARDLDIVLIDALEPFGLDRVFPRGMLREPVTGLKRAHLVGLSRADLISPKDRMAIRQKVQQLNPTAGWVELAHVPSGLHGKDGDRTITELQGRRVLAFCGIGNPSAFRQTLESCGANILDFRTFPDHHEYSPNDASTLRAWTKACKPDLMVCTHKDLVKLDVDDLAGTPLFALMVELKALEGESQLQDRLEPIIRTASP